MFSATLANALLKLLFQGIAIANLADDATVAPLADLQLALHADDPGVGGDQSTNEATYGSYARIAVARTAVGWTVTGNDAVNAAELLFPEATSGDELITHVSVGYLAAGAGTIITRAALGAILGAFVGEADDEVLTIKGHGLSVSDRVSFYAQEGQALPGALTEGQLHFVKSVPDADSITVATTDGGATVNLTSDGGGRAYSGIPLRVTGAPAVQPRIAAGALAFSLN